MDSILKFGLNPLVSKGTLDFEKETIKNVYLCDFPLILIELMIKNFNHKFIQTNV